MVFHNSRTDREKKIFKPDFIKVKEADCVCVCLCVYRLVAELQQLVSQSVCISDEFLQSLFEADGFFKDLITAIHTHWV